MSPGRIISWLLHGGGRDRPRSSWDLAGARIRARALSPDWQVAPMAQATVAADLDQPFDVHLHFAAQIAFNLVILRDILTQER